MWPYRRQSNNYDNDNNNNNNACTSPKIRRIPSNPDFNPHSLKNIETLISSDDRINSQLDTIVEEYHEPSSTFSPQIRSAPCMGPTKPSIFHRVHLANRFSRLFTPRPRPEEILSESIKQDEISPKSNKSDDIFSSESNRSEQPENLDDVKNVVKPETFVTPRPRINVPGGEKRVVVYMTSIRAVRPTFEACRTVRSILQGFRVPIDERDLCMDASFSDEIKKIMRQMGQAGFGDKRITLPRVFIGGRYIGGADEVVELHEIGELKKFVSGLPAVTGGVCESCGGFRFILCYECNGSHKCYIDDHGGFRTCLECNENGLIRCPSCSCS
ncbi:uncharacterized protein [Rutidosis leptorrhynchoides]|uniref:uncharacterized protein n=1 Tax=Rutidosis leptorrhynchoides TaxID=125765 RepID=UPI003A9A4C6C